MNWIRRVLGRWAPGDLPPVVASAERGDLARAKIEQLRILTRAEVAIHEAMAHADEVFTDYRGQERRRRPR